MHSSPLRSSTHREGSDAVTMIALPSPYDFLLARFAPFPMVLVGKLQGSFVCLRPSGAKEGLRLSHLLRSPLLKFISQFLSRLIVHLTPVTEGHDPGLFRYGLDHLFHAVANANNPNPSDCVQVPLSGLIEHIDSISFS